MVKCRYYLLNYIMNNLHKFDIYKRTVDASYIASCATNYLQLLTSTAFDPSKVDSDPRFSDVGFSSSKLKELIKKYSTPSRKTTTKKDDIYRSDLGELIMISFFEKTLKSKYPNEENFIIPIKNIATRENIDMPARGLDVVGYRNGETINLLLGEAKVSEERNSPPKVVDKNKDSLYETHTKHRTDKEYLLKKLMTVARKLSYEHSNPFLQVIGHIEDNQFDKFKIVYGCCLVRDSHCHKPTDFGKMKSSVSEFEPNSVHFLIVSFDKSITETVDAFHKKVIELSN